jgi:phosphoribosyl 1,2-cyclic phosphate phosphodiesterase
MLIEYNNTIIVIDSGPDFRQQMLREKVAKLDGLVFTHAHKDHIAGFDDIRGFNFKSKKPVDVYCTDIVEDQMRKEFHYIFSELKYPGIPEINLHRISAHTPFSVSDCLITPIEVMHYKLPVLGFRVGDFVYITDANNISKASMNKIKGCKVLVINALRKETHISHFTLNEALQIIKQIKPEQAYLTHISHQLGLHDEVSKELPSNVFLGYDGLKITI